MLGERLGDTEEEELGDWEMVHDPEVVRDREAVGDRLPVPVLEPVAVGLGVKSAERLCVALPVALRVGDIVGRVAEGEGDVECVEVQLGLQVCVRTVVVDGVKEMEAEPEAVRDAVRFREAERDTEEVEEGEVVSGMLGDAVGVCDGVRERGRDTVSEVVAEGLRLCVWESVRVSLEVGLLVVVGWAVQV